ncbi:hypothetical protein [Synechococcus sp. MIT S9503]|uniref:hypothetical protein n=1 Tax=Synechococcus sp. MIT S9503 TaxID=3082547 RepID=UPI0039A479D3|tara:strand:+ start:379 stop:561 length:183 start_codon:yes stop_codon:yes gene_type:complete
MPGIIMENLLLFTNGDQSDREHMIQMIQNSIASRGRGKSLLSAIVLALFVFGVIQMLSNA